MKYTKKSSVLYFGIIFIWLSLLACFGNDLTQVFRDAQVFANLNSGYKKTLVPIASVIVVTLIAYFWLNGLKDIFYTVIYWLIPQKSKFASTQIKYGKLGYAAKVGLIYTVCDDFDPQSLKKCLNQDYPNNLLTYYILDDSKTYDSKERVDIFAKKNNIKVIRRSSNKGYKAGNINNWLYQNKNYDEFFVLLDSDEIIPNDFVSKSIQYFTYSNVSIVQANHISTRNYTKFADLFSCGVESHWITYQAIKDRFGFLSLLGHGAMLRTEDVKKVGGFPEVVAEDLALSIKLSEINKKVVFAKDIMCEETYPVDYFAFKKRHTKWTMGNMEFIKKFSGLFFSKKLRWFEKVDILLFVYNLPLTIFFIFFLLIHLLLFPFLGFTPVYAKSLLLPTILTLIAPLLNDLIYCFGKKGVIGYIRYFISTIVLYGSLYFISFWSAIKALFGQAVFLVTPKVSEKYSILNSILKNRGEILFGSALIYISFLINQVWSVILIIIPSFLSVSLGLLGNKVNPEINHFLKKMYQTIGTILVITGTLIGINSSFLLSKVVGVNSYEVKNHKKNKGLEKIEKQITPENVNKVNKCINNILNGEGVLKCK